jgi:flagellar basal body-associated protein FliL
MSNGDSKREPTENDPAKLAQLLEIELMQKRAQWQQTKARRGSLRAIAFLFLFVVILGALVAFFVFFSPSRVSELKSQAPQPTASAAP